MSQRRLPVYILLDCSESMIGGPIEAVQGGVEMLLRQLRSDPHALETAYVSIITYHATAQQVVPLSELSEVRAPQLAARPGTSLGAALRLLGDCIRREVRKTTVDRKGDYRPIVFLLTDGQPTDDWESARDAVGRTPGARIANFYAIGCGDDVDFDSLHRVGDAVFKLADVTPETLKKLFLWLTASVQGASMGAGAAGAPDSLDGIDLEKKPSEVREVPVGSEPRHDGIPRQVFLKCYCSRVRRPYLMRFRLEREYGGYVPVASHPLETTLEDKAPFELPALNSSMLLGCPACPYCSNPAAGVCSCEALMCAPAETPAKLLCPRCLKQITLGSGGGEFAINQSAG